MLELDRRALGLLAALSCVCCVGCSFPLVSSPPANASGHDYVHCTSSVAAPIMDVVGTAGAALSAGASAANNPNDNAGLLVFGAIALLYGASASYGFVTTHNCNVAQDQAAVRRQKRYGTPLAPTAPVATAP